MPTTYASGYEIVPGYTLIEKLGSGMAGEVWTARASGGVTVAIKIIRDLQLVGGKRELGALRVVREVKHPNLCPLFGIWFFDRDGTLFDAMMTDRILCSESDAHVTKTDRARESDTDVDATDTIAFEDSSQGDLSQGTRDTRRLEPIGDTPEGDHPIPAIPPHDVAPHDDSLHQQPSKMVLAMGLGEQTLFDRLVEVQAERRQAEMSHTAGRPDSSGGNGLDVDELLRYMSGAASAIDELNTRHQIYHCDIKPQNILIVGGQAQVCDFGLARQVEGEHQTQLAFGTPAYGAPEMLFGRTYSRTIDQYSLAMTYYHLRTGRLPSEGMTQSSYLKAKASGNLSLTRVFEPEARVIERATDLEPEKRFESCQAFVAALESAVKSPIPTRESGKHWGRWAVPAVLLVAVGLAAVAWRNRSNGSSNKDLSELREETSVALSDSATGDPVTSDPATGDPATGDPVTSDPRGDSDRDPLVETIRPLPDTTEESLSESKLVESTIAEPSDLTAMELPSDATIERELAKEAKAPLSMTQRPKAQQPEKPAPNINESLAVLLQSTPVTDGMFPQLSQKLTTMPTELREQVSKDSLGMMLDQLGQFTSSQFWAIDFSSNTRGRSLPGADSLYRTLSSWIDEYYPDERDFRLRLGLIQLQLANIDPTTTSSDFSLVMSEVRRILPKDARVDALTADALLTLCRTYDHPRSPAWDAEVVERDLTRAAALQTGDRDFQARLDRCRGTQLIQLLRNRTGAAEMARLDVLTKSVAERLRESPRWSSIAAAAKWMIDNGDPVEDTLAGSPLPESPPQTLPDDLLPLYRLAVGWSAWQSGEDEFALNSWKQVAENPRSRELISPLDRQRAAEHLLRNIIRSSSMENDDSSKIKTRYTASHSFAIAALGVSEDLAFDSESIRRSVSEETLLCAAAAGDFLEAEKRWKSIRSSSNRISPRLGYALYRLADEQLRQRGAFENSKSRQKWTQMLVMACLSQASVAGDLSQESDQTDRLFRDAFRPTIERIKPLIEAKSVESNSMLPMPDSDMLAEFCRKFVQLVAVRHRRSDYENLVSWWNEVEQVARFAGENERNPDDRVELFAIASDACLQSRLEHEEDIRFDAVTNQLKTYHSAATVGDSGPSRNKWLADSLAARIGARQVFRDRSSMASAGKYDPSINQYDAAIAEARKRNSTRLADLLRERSFLQIRKSMIVEPSKSAELQRDALADARNAVAADLPWHSNRESCLVNFADICGRVVAANIADKTKRIENNRLLDEGERAIDQAMERRRADSFDFTSIAVKKLVLLHFDLAVNKSVDAKRFEKKKAEATQLISQYSKPGTSNPEETSLPADSDYLKCFWHSAVSQLYVDLGQIKTAMSHTMPAYEIASKRLDERERLYEKVLLQYVGQVSALSAEALGSGRRPELASELIAILRRIENPPPDIKDVQSQMIRVLQPHARK